MKISSKQAINIVENLKGVINHDINYIDLDSIIIASTDPSRIGHFHGGSKKVYETKSPVIVYSSDKYLGTKVGINYPVKFENEIIATIGITGEYDEIKKFSSVIVKMTEILIKEFYFRDQREIREENDRYIVGLLINNREPIDSIISIANSFNIELKSIKRVVVIKLQDKPFDNINIRKMIFNSIKKRLHHDEIVVNNQKNFVLLLKSTSINKLKDIKEYLTKKYSVELAIGYSEEINDISEIYINYLNAERLVYLAIKMLRFEIVTLKDFDLELILSDIDETYKKAYLSKVFGNIEPSTIKKWSEMLIVFSKNDGSINLTSKELYIHKNTLQYRLKKIKELTGYDPRKLRDFSILYIATLLYRQ